jgi:hypothetical protein
MMLAVKLPAVSTMPGVNLPPVPMMSAVNFPPVSTMPAVNLPLVSTMPAVNLPLVSTMTADNLPLVSTMPAVHLPLVSPMSAVNFPPMSTKPAGVIDTLVVINDSNVEVHSPSIEHEVKRPIYNCKLHPIESKQNILIHNCFSFAVMYTELRISWRISIHGKENL